MNFIKHKNMRRIFLTGAPRSGTTFVGTILSVGIKVDYIHEPFNPDCGLEIIKERYLYIRPAAGRSSDYFESFEDLLNYRAKLKTGFYETDSLGVRLAKYVVGSRGPISYRNAKLNPFSEIAVIKDPIGSLLTNYLSSTFGVLPVILVRHPVAFVASFLKVWQLEEWQHDFSFIRNQPELIEDYFSNELERIYEAEKSPLTRVAMLWRVLNKVLLSQAESAGVPLIYRHEDISDNPVPHFRELFCKLEIPWTSRAESLIKKRTSSSNKAESRQGRVQDLNRNSSKIFELRKNMLSREEREKVFEITKDVALGYYDEASFSI